MIPGTTPNKTNNTARYGIAMLGLLLGSVLAGVAGFYWIEHQNLTDSLMSAVMSLSGTGPIYAPVSTAGKLFTTAFAMYSRVLTLVVLGLATGLIFAAIVAPPCPKRK